jgi:hypothetical protein
MCSAPITSYLEHRRSRRFVKRKESKLDECQSVNGRVLAAVMSSNLVVNEQQITDAIQAFAVLLFTSALGSDGAGRFCVFPSVLIRPARPMTAVGSEIRPYPIRDASSSATSAAQS